MSKVTSRLQVPVPKANEARLELFDQATERQRERQKSQVASDHEGKRGWTRDELYDRG